MKTECLGQNLNSIKEVQIVIHYYVCISLRGLLLLLSKVIIRQLQIHNERKYQHKQ